MSGLFDKIAGLFTKKTPAPTPPEAPRASPKPAAVLKKPEVPTQAPPAPVVITAKPPALLKPGMITKHFAWAEVVASQTARGLGIDNALPENLRGNARIQANLMQLVRDQLGAPVQITSWYRCPRLNAAVGGVSNSAHLTGLACDFVCPSVGDPLTVARMVSSMLDAQDIDFDQLIHEGGWVHLAIGPGRRRQRLTILGGPAREGLLSAAEYRRG